MKKYLFIIALLLGTVSSWGQDLSKDYVLVDQSAPKFDQLKSQFSGHAHVFINENTKPAPYIIAEMMKGQSVADLHIYVATQPGGLDFNSVKITVSNLGEYEQFLKSWKIGVSGKVIIHSDDVFSLSAGLAFKVQLETITGLEFTTP